MNSTVSHIAPLVKQLQGPKLQQLGSTGSVNFEHHTVAPQCWPQIVDEFSPGISYDVFFPNNQYARELGRILG